jgi:hypothetical protein
MLTLTLVENLHSRSVDFVLAYTQAEIDIDIYMELPPGVIVDGFDRKDLVLKLEKNYYGLKQAGKN